MINKETGFFYKIIRKEADLHESASFATFAAYGSFLFYYLFHTQ